MATTTNTGAAAAPDDDEEVLNLDIANTFVLHNGGVTVEERPCVGRTAIATRHQSCLYANILREKPALVVENNYHDLVLKFASCDAQTQAGILDMHHPPLTSDLAFKKRASAEKLHRQLQREGNLSTDNYSVDFLHKLLAIFACNAHEYSYRENTSIPDSAAETKWAALFLWGSKLAHSCHPNLAYTSKSGALEYSIIRTPIQKGDVLSFSYISQNLYKIPTYKRRHFLQRTKAFFCDCERCSGPDYCRVVHCPNCQQLIPCVYHPSTYQPTWACPQCGSQDAAQIQAQERELEQRLTSLDLQQYREADSPPNELQILADLAVQTLSSTHHITITALEFLAPIYSHHARQQSTNRTDLRIQAVTTACQATAASECVASSCVGCDKAHDALYDRALAMWETALDLLELPNPQRPAQVVAMVQRYLPVLRGHSSSKADLLQSLEREFGTATPKTAATKGAPRRCCSSCGKAPDRLLRCSRCQASWYCNRNCQLHHYKAGHKQTCRTPTSK